MLASQIRLPLDLDHSCRSSANIRADGTYYQKNAERGCVACQYIRGYEDAQKEVRRDHN